MTEVSGTGDKKSCGTNMKKFFKKIDVYGVPVGLTYKSEP
jgi:hypothetical protein